MEKLAKTLNSVVDSLTYFLEADLAVITLVVVFATLYLLYKLTTFVVKYTIGRSAQFGHMESIAVAYKSLHEGIDPATALREIKRELDDFK